MAEEFFASFKICRVGKLLQREIGRHMALIGPGRFEIGGGMPVCWRAPVDGVVYLSSGMPLFIQPAASCVLQAADPWVVGMCPHGLWLAAWADAIRTFPASGPSSSIRHGSVGTSTAGATLARRRTQQQKATIPLSCSNDNHRPPDSSAANSAPCRKIGSFIVAARSTARANKASLPATTPSHICLRQVARIAGDENPVLVLAPISVPSASAVHYSISSLSLCRPLAPRAHRKLDSGPFCNLPLPVLHTVGLRPGNHTTSSVLATPDSLGHRLRMPIARATTHGSLASPTRGSSNARPAGTSESQICADRAGFTIPVRQPRTEGALEKSR
ncbi:hypothetical protein CC78DRAFT_618659 [Lojkania enalia]|uniref:Uncharacterized protein n=1 Tax=Lojkania enalia TaxID=147567 RepID=A0A9P4N1D9_9PLEO|nr:hypothetical protein CC78DRAFT_618659 [Didymosphaeria enalia]